VSVDEVEEATGLDFCSELPDDVESRLESECNPNKWNR
jgi:DNA/RNA endonuclease G (NUC1)